MTTTTADPTLAYPVMTAERFPWGLRCPYCHRDIQPGEPFTDRLSAMHPDGAVITTLTCVYCQENQ